MEHIEEIQGLYGPFMMTERVLQKIWLRQDFCVEALSTASGKSIVVKDPGRWNLKEGPDFKDASLLMNGQLVSGDIEVHFHLRDWLNHQHAMSPDFKNVVLHVVLHPLTPKDTAPVVTTSTGGRPETLYLMPHLDRDLEEYVSDEALLELEKQDSLDWVTAFVDQDFDRRMEILMNRAEERWNGKVAYAKKRVEAHSWSEACHQYALEVLGYARNRAPMSALALAYPLSKWSVQSLDIESLFSDQVGVWRLNALRPANQPRRRLAQYQAIVENCPDWPNIALARLRSLKELPVDMGTKRFRQESSLSALKEAFSNEVFSSVLGEKRMHTLICDALLPLAAASGLANQWAHWFHWSPGDAPDGVRVFLKHAQVTGKRQPSCNGLNQGALSLFFSRGNFE